MNANTGVSTRLPFQVRVTPADIKDQETLYISVFFRFNGRPSGRIMRSIVYLPQGGLLLIPFGLEKTSTPHGQYLRRRRKGEVILPRENGSSTVTIESTAQPADIRVEILKTEENDGQHFTLRCLYSAKEWSGAWNFPQSTKELVKAIMQRFVIAPVEARVNRLKAAGLDFWKALPIGARSFLLDGLEKGAQSMAIVSEEPYIPWELMIPHRSPAKTRKPLGVELRLGRWVTGEYVSAQQSIRMRSIHIVCPEHSGLKHSQAELAFLSKLPFNPNSSVTPASYAGLDIGLQGPKRDIVHFICHGKSATIQTLQLDPPDTIDCSEVRTIPGFLNAFEDGSFAFLNACEVGGQVLTLDGVGGFANAFIELGASGVVAPLWPVQDEIALKVANMFYQGVLAGTRYSEIMKTIRQRAYELGVDSYAAYCFYGDPESSAVTQ